MNNIKNNILNFLDTDWDGTWQNLEMFCSLKQGKGWGTCTIKNEVESCLNLLNKSPEFIVDIGANKGIYTETLLSLFPNATYFLFEPSITNLNIICSKFEKKSNIFCSNYALSNKNCTEKLYTNEYGSGLASLTKRRLDHFDIYMNLEETVDVIRFDDFLKFDDIPKNLPKIIDYVKIDVEGNELKVLEGFGDLLKDIKLIQFEFGGCNIDTKTYFQDFWYFFIKNNFSLYIISQDGPIKIEKYSESYEYFSTTNYIALNNLMGD
jgi:FkbM family methyltransferase